MRIQYIDFTKGFAIILMLLGHTIPTINCIHIWIYSFHMPLFFIICGILINEKEKSEKSYRYRDIMIRRLYTGWIPYYTFGIILALFYLTLDIVANKPNTFGVHIFKLLTFQGIDSLWFLPIYIFAELIVIAINKLQHNKKKIHLSITIGSFIVISVFSNLMQIWYLDIIYKILIGIFCIEIGMLISKFSVINKISIYLSLILIICGFLLAQINGDVEMSASNIGNPIIYFLCVLITSIAIMSLFKKIENYKILSLNVLETYGKNSIVLLCTNNLLIEMIRLFDYKYTGNALINLGMIGSVIFTLILMLVEWWIIKFVNKGLFAPLFGYFKK